LPVFEEVIAETNEADPALYELLADLSAAQYGLGNYAEAEQTIRHALALECEVTVQNRIGAIENLSAFLSAQGKHEEALQVIEEAVDLAARAFGAMNPTTLQARVNQGSLFWHSGNADKAAEIFENLLPAIQSTLGMSHNWYLTVKSNLANAYLVQGKYDKSEKLLVEMIEWYEKINGANHPRTLANRLSLGFLYRKMGNRERAIAIYSKNLPLLREQLGAEHPEVKRPERTLEEMLAERA
jgi:tetratricopeptide (TPR) repeat protein